MTIASPTPAAQAPATRRWRLRELDAAAIGALARRHSISRVTAAILVARGHADPERALEHLKPELKRLHDPALLPDMGRATERVARALRDRETILVHGDYDVDGVTGTALLVRLLTTLGGDVRWHIPNRFTDGYSFGEHSLARARETGAKLVISVDNGTSAVETIAALAEAGVDTLVTDHHEPPQCALPPAVAIVNPKLGTSAYPFRELCGGAVAFKLAWGLAQEITGAARVRDDLREFLVEAMGYVAIATVADVVPLVGENRILAHHGLKSLERSARPGVRALLEVCGATGRELLAEDLGYQIGPRINAAGRLDHARRAVELLLADDAVTARRLAGELDRLNQRRRAIEAEILHSALQQAARFADRERWPVLVLADQGWHQGVVGIVAGRLVQRFDRPVVVIGLDGARGRGSARSVPGFSVLSALDGGREHVLKHGGHEQAAGLEIEAERVDAFREAVCARAREMLAAGPLAAPALDIDCDVPFHSVTPALQKELDRLQPFGAQNARPLFHSADLRLAEPARTCGADQSHVLLQLRSGAHVLRGMAFGMARREPELVMGTPIHAVYTPKWNHFRGETRLEIEIVDFRTGPAPALGSAPRPSP
ncbi:MAG: single-stranded-DNA-specific exonuclease RecJ [Planctomycetes bacterium]|nr:single-stranded-DNA-specific exonuclease RecJ [Planctomycetota bacterium]